MGKKNTYGAVLVQSYATYAEAEAAVSSLVGAGLSRDAISIAATHPAETAADDKGPDTLSRDESLASPPLDSAVDLEPRVVVQGDGIVVGGPLVEVLVRSSQDTQQLGLARALRGLGVDKEEAAYFKRRFEEGDFLVVAAITQPEPSTPLPSDR